ncbi:SGNH/GDSL hydrolase family protein [Actinoplanes sp. DH11]|uniref:SGNH/GDSL hydrolase family protein n=1 Tax=Actinoplanes sp. DH11 TaxID=2857011 RepID=UPI001E4B8176|nr:SGNH/GDSL hydrolase family protein [Actinoplanes sp. DH11]
MRRLFTLLVAALAATSALSAPAGATGGSPSWVGTWSTAVTGAALPPQPATVFTDQTLRQIVRVSTAGSEVRVRLSNEYGTEPLVVGAARVARRPAGATGSEIQPGTDRALTVGGRSAFTIPPGAPALSDPVRLSVPALSDLVISIHLPRRTPAATVHGSAFQRNFVAAGDVTRAPVLAGATETTSWHFLSGVSVAARPASGVSAADVARPASGVSAADAARPASGVRAAVPARAGSVVAFGDSITDGAITTVDANRRWPDLLARRLQADRSLRHLGVLNKGIGGNRILHDGNTLAGTPFAGLGPLFGDSALSRFDRDVAAQPGARCVVVLLGINDIGQPGSTSPVTEEVSVDDLIAGYRQLIARAHERGLTIYGATLTPFEDTTIPGYYTAANERKRQAVNRWIRTGGEWDGVIDFDRAVRDPARPLRMLPAYDSGDHLHPGDAGMQAMADAIPLRLFTR